MRRKLPREEPARRVDGNTLGHGLADVRQKRAHRPRRRIVGELTECDIGSHARPELQFQLVKQRDKVADGQRQPSELPIRWHGPHRYRPERLGAEPRAQLRLVGRVLAERAAAACLVHDNGGEGWHD
jgi:hypothetical protein